MTRHNSLKLFAACVMFMSLASAAHAQQPTTQPPDAFAAQHEQAAAQNPEGVIFMLRLADGKTQFRQGEIIRLELAFSSSAPGKYVLNNRSYDRSGRLDMDNFHLSPTDGLVDPLHDYFYESVFGGFIGGGLFSPPELKAKPVIITEELNEWYRFDRPGKYQLYVTSPRIGRGYFDIDAHPLVATSNTVEFEIMPAERAWLKQKLTEITQALDGQGKVKDQARRARCRELRFLGSEDAARAMVRHYQGRDNECDFEYDFGLIGSPHRALIVAEMERQLSAPDFPVASGFLQTLALLSFFQQRPAPLPPYPAGNEAQSTVWQQAYQARREAFNQVTQRYLERLTAAVFAKDKAARAVSLDTLLSNASVPRGQAPPATIAQEKTMAAALTSIFSELPPDSQSMLLEYRWRQIGSPDMLPVLRRIFQQPPQTNERIRDVALRRIYELAPDEGRQLILAEIRRPQPRVGIEALGLLPEQTLPEVDSLVVERLANGKDSARAATPEELFDDELFAALIERYASGAVQPQVSAAYEDKIGRVACRTQTPLLAYFLRVAPSYGAKLVEQALTARTDTRCYESEFTNLAGLHFGSALVETAAAHLDDSDTVVVAQAASVLGGYGGTDAEQLLWARLAQGHERWAGREKELSAQQERDLWTAQTQVETALVRALGMGTSWLTDEAKLNRLRQLCVTKQCRQEVENFQRQLNTSISVSFGEDERIDDASVAQYHFQAWSDLKDKVAQFPRGTSFTWQAFNADAPTEARFFNELKAHLEAHGLKLVKPPPDDAR